MELKTKIEGLLRSQFQGAKIALHSDDDVHFSLFVKWKGFNDMTILQQHKEIYKILKQDIDTGILHALQIKTEGVVNNG